MLDCCANYYVFSLKKKLSGFSLTAPTDLKINGGKMLESSSLL